mgnify:CR=1 FL=1
MFWVKQYCNYFNLKIAGCEIYEDSDLVGKIDLYDEIVTFGNKKYLFRHLAQAGIENFKLHGEMNYD